MPRILDASMWESFIDEKFGMAALGCPSWKLLVLSMQWAGNSVSETNPPTLSWGFAGGPSTIDGSKNCPYYTEGEPFYTVYEYGAYSGNLGGYCVGSYDGYGFTYIRWDLWKGKIGVRPCVKLTSGVKYNSDNMTLEF